jgi:hypothetical protein
MSATIDANAKVSSSTELLKALGSQINLKAALCVSCSNFSVNLLFSENAVFKWAVDIRCMNCSTSWSICRECTNHRSKMSKLCLMNRHSKVYHVNGSLHDNFELINEDSQAMNICPDNGAELGPPLHMVDNESFSTFNDVGGEDTNVGNIDACFNAVEAERPSNPVSYSYASSVSKLFFEYDLKRSSGGGGATYLVTRALTETAAVVADVVHPQDVSYHMRVGKFVTKLTRLQRAEFAYILAETEALLKGVNQDCKNYLPSSLPTSHRFIDNVYVRGKYSLLKNSPCPTVSVIDNHGYVSLKDCVAHLLSFHSGFSISHSGGHSGAVPAVVTKLTESAAVRKIKERAVHVAGTEDVIVLYCTEWSDDFDPSVSTKSNRQSCWIKTGKLA